MKFAIKFAAVAAAAAGFAASAHAAIDASVGTALTAIQGDAADLSALVIPVVVSIMGLGIVIKLIKRFGNKV